MNSIFGLLATWVGIYALAPCFMVMPEGATELVPLLEPSRAFRLLDTLLTAGLIASGSEGVHQVTSALTSAMEARSKANQWRVSRR